MSDPLLAFALKLPLALLVFLVIAYAGTTDRRIAGVLFTFPILNGVAIIASPQPIVVADAIYPLVIFNCALFALVISFPQALPPVGPLPRGVKLVARVAVWSLVWLAGAYLVTDFRAAIPGALVLFVASLIFAILFMLAFLDVDGLARMERSAMRGRSRISLRFIRATDFAFALLGKQHRPHAYRLLRARLCVPVLRRTCRARREMGRHGKRAAAPRLLRARRADG